MSRHSEQPLVTSDAQWPSFIQALTSRVGETAPDVALQLRRFLRLVASNPTAALSPSPLVDSAWHFLLTYTRLYGVACADATQVAGSIIAHDPDRSNDVDDDIRARYATTLRLYTDAFCEEPPASMWPRDYKLKTVTSAGEERLFNVKLCDQSSIRFRAKVNLRLSNVFKAFCEKIGVCLNDLHFYYYGDRLHGEETVGGIGIIDGDTIYALPQQSGC